MDEFPNAEDEYEMLHADELEMMREFDSKFLLTATGVNFVHF